MTVSWDEVSYVCSARLYVGSVREDAEAARPGAYAGRAPRKFSVSEVGLLRGGPLKCTIRSAVRGVQNLQR
jgi:hypothetical protein